MVNHLKFRHLVFILLVLIQFSNSLPQLNHLYFVTTPTQDQTTGLTYQKAGSYNLNTGESIYFRNIQVLGKTKFGLHI